MDLPKTYNPQEVEDKIYKRWEQSGFFNPDNLEQAHDRYWKAEPFSIAMPPPNITAELHVGHAMFLTIQDLMVRHARMSGKKTLWLPGTDHAAIATQNVVERELWEKEKKTRHDVGREELLRRIEEFIKKTRGRIQVQIRKLGSSCDWSREKYTLSPELSLAVRTAFKKLYDAGLIYRGERIVNWCQRCATTLADDEVEYQEEETNIYYVLYPFPKAKGGIVISTVRPETMLGDTAVAVHPQHPQYKKYIGKSVMQPLVNREIPIIADPLLDLKYGTGAIKVTPAHDHHDFELAQKHNLEIINVFGADGKVDEQEAIDHGFEQYAGLSVREVRNKVVEDLSARGFLEKTEVTKHNLSLCYRCETPVEPIVSKQWFVNVTAKFKIEDSSPLAVILSGAKDPNAKRDSSAAPQNDNSIETTLKEMAVAAVKSGAIKIIPERFAKIYLQWMENLRDWNISRQIWFGHRIPVWYCQACGEAVVEIETPSKCAKCNHSELIQDPDTLDTWFSSSLWTFSTLGWPSFAKATEGKPSDLMTYHPTTIMETGYDILFFWVARMVLMTGFVLEDIPFRTVYLNGLVRDKKGRKMSKSLKNALDPLEVCKKYGTDALRLSLIMGTTPGNDLKISEEKIAGFRNFANKLWNIARYILTTSKNSPPSPSLIKEGVRGSSLTDQWILAELDDLILQVNQHFANYQYGLAAEALYDFTWNKFADWYIEIAKLTLKRHPREELALDLIGDGDPVPILNYILQTLLKLWHPFIPFVTEHIWSQFSKEMLMVQDYPTSENLPPLPPPLIKGGKERGGVTSQFTKLQLLITGLRNLRAEYRQDPAETFASYLELPKELSWIKEQLPIIEKLARVKMNFEKLPADKKMPYFLWANTKVYLIIPDFDPQKEKALAQKELKQVESLLKKLEAQLGKSDFLQKAPGEIVEKIKADAETAKTRSAQLNEKIKSLR